MKSILSNKKKSTYYLTFLALLIFSSFVISETSNSEDTSVWRSDGRTLENNRYYPDILNSNISTATPNQYTMPATVYTSPLVADDYLYFTSGTSKGVYQMNYSNYTQQIANFTGAGNTVYAPAVANNYLYVPSGNYIYQLNASNVSEEIANFSAGSTVYSPTVVNDSVYLTSSNALFRLNSSNVSQEFERYTASSLAYSPTYSNGYVYVSHTSTSFTFYQLNASNVSQKIANSPSQGRYLSTPPVISGDYAYICNSRHLSQYNSSNVSQNIGYYTFNPSLSTACYPNPVSSNGYVYFASTNPTYIFQLNESNVSQLIGSKSIGSSASKNYLLANDNYIYIGTSSNIFYQLDASNVSNEIGRYSLGGSIAGPTAVDGKLLFSKQTTILYEILNLNPSSIQTAPENAYALNNQTNNISFSCSSSYTIDLANISLYLTNSSDSDFILNQTTSVSGTSNSTSWSLNLTYGNYTWGCLATGSDGNFSYSSNRTLYDNYSIYDTTYPQFSSLNDNNATLNNSGTGTFNVTILNTNGTVILEINNTNVSAENLTSFVYNTTYSFTTNGTYTYKWYSYGNGTNENINSSSQISYYVNYLDTVYPQFSSLNDNSNTLTGSGTGTFNVTILNTNGTAFLEIDNLNYTATNNSNVFNASVNLSSSGTYTYKWYSYGNGTDKNLNSTSSSYVVSSSTPEISESITSSGSSGGGFIISQKLGKDSIKIRLYIPSGQSLERKIKGNSSSLKSIELKTKDWISGEIIVKSFNEVPDFCSIKNNKNYTVYQVLDFNTSIDDKRIDSGKLNIGIKKDWIYKNNVSEIEIVRCYPDYQLVKSSYQNETEEEGLYDVYIDGFSAYAILGTFQDSIEGQDEELGEKSNFNFLRFFGKIFFWLIVLFIGYLLISFLINHRIRLKQKFHNKLFDLKMNISFKLNR